LNFIQDNNLEEVEELEEVDLPAGRQEGKKRRGERGVYNIFILLFPSHSSYLLSPLPLLIPSNPL